MGEPFSGAAVGVLFTEVITAVKEAINTIRLFRPRLQQISSSLTDMEPLVIEMIGLDEQLEKPNKELKPIYDILKECQRLINKCCKFKPWNFASLHSLSKMLLVVDNRLDRYCKYQLQLIMARDGKATLLKVEQIYAIKTRPASSSTSVVVEAEENRHNSTRVDLALGTLVGALVAELLLLKQAIEATQLGTTELMLESLKPQIEDQMNTSNGKEELRPIHGLLKAGLGLINKCRTLREYQFSQVELDSGIRRLCQVDLVGILFGDVKTDNTVNVSKVLRDEMARLSVLLEKDKTIPFESSSDVPQLMDRVRVLLEKGKTFPFKSSDVPLCPDLVKMNTTRRVKFRGHFVPPGPDYVVGYESEDFPFRYIKEKLLSGEEPVIVITGCGGYGKTTLVTKLCHDEQVTGKFKDIIFISAPASPSLMALIQQIINHLGEQIADLDTLTEDDAVQILQQLLADIAKQNPILLVLDDLWYGAESILDKFVNKDIPNYAVLVTSRSEISGIKCSHKLKGLKHGDAVRLLYHVAVLPNEMRPLNDELIDEVAKRCKGSPLALIIVGKSLRGKSRVVWKIKLRGLSKGMSIFDNMGDLLSIILMDSLKGLDGTEELERVKKCFLDLGSFPEDHRICVAALVDMWSVLYGIDANGVDAIAAIIELSARNLLDVITTREYISFGHGYYNNMHVMQTDVLMRELIIYLNTEGPVEERERLNLTIRKNNLPDWLLMEQKQTPFKARVVSICTDEGFSSAWPDLELPAAEVLVLNFRTEQRYYTLPSFIKKMVNLKTLIVTNNGPVPVNLSNFHLIASLINLKKIRLEGIKIDFHPNNNMPADFCLGNLEKITAFLCDISEEIQTTSLQIHNVFPKLEEMDISYCHNLKTLPDGICSAAETLKTISITDCKNLSQLPQEIGNLSVLQVLRLNSCTNLYWLPTSIGDLKNLSFLDISNCFSIDKLPTRIEELYQLKELHLSWCFNLSSLPPSIRYSGCLSFGNSSNLNTYH